MQCREYAKAWPLIFGRDEPLCTMTETCSSCSAHFLKRRCDPNVFLDKLARPEQSAKISVTTDDDGPL